MRKAFCTNHGVVRILPVLPTSVHKFNHDLLQKPSVDATISLLYIFIKRLEWKAKASSPPPST